MSDGAESAAHYFALPTGSRLYEFEIEALLGHGGFGITYRAMDTLLQEAVAIKEYLPNEVGIRVSDATVRAKTQQQQPDFEAGLKSFLEEARVMARFRHPRIVHVRRFFELHGTGYIVLDYEHGQTLSERLSAGPMPDAELRSILSGVLDGLEVIHGRAILHRDLKPNNIMLREDGAPVIIDFGAARDFQARHSRSITAIATAGYAPPEQYGVGGQQGPWSDLYALGAIAYRAVSGEPPVDSLRRLRKDPLIPAVVAGSGRYDAALLQTIDWMLKIDEADRPASVAQVREALRGGPVVETSRPASPHTSDQTEASRITRPPSRRGRGMAIAPSLLVFAGLTAGTYAFYADHQAEQRKIQQADLEAKQQAERQIQQVKERQQQLAEQLADVGTDQTKLEQFVTACGSSCPHALRAEAQARIDTNKQQQRQAELARQEEATYRVARGDLAKLRAYVANCQVCSLKTDANSELERLSDDTEYSLSRGHVDKLEKYVRTCRICSHVNEARAETESLEQQRKEAEKSAGMRESGRRCSEEAGLHSISGTLSTFVTFVNQTSGPVFTYWLNYQGQRVFYTQVSSGQKYRQQTYLTHPWVVTDSHQNCLAVFMPEQRPTVQVIR